MDLSKITNQHLINKIKFYRRMLLNKPSPQHYTGNSDYAEDAVECENTHYEVLAEKIEEHICDLKKEAKKRKLEVK